MKSAILCILFLGTLASADAQTFYGSTDVKAFRVGRDKEFRDKKESPLKEKDFGRFRGLNYFPVDKRFRVQANFSLTPSEKFFEMPTSSGKSTKFVKFGVLKFTLIGKSYSLSVYKNDPEISALAPEYADLLFIPFKDATNRTETYGGGRYMNITTPRSTTVILDFNNAYNPNCAYGSDKYSCPLPPNENTLATAIRAGEKRYAYSGYEKLRWVAPY